MQFQPMSDEEISRGKLLPEGNYDFEVLDAWEEKSKKGNDMLVMKLKVWDHDGKERQMRDWLLPSFPKKLKHFCQFTGMLDKYNAGNLVAFDCHNKTGKIKVVVGKDQEGNDRNSIADYLPLNRMSSNVQTPKKENDFLDDDISF